MHDQNDSPDTLSNYNSENPQTHSRAISPYSAAPALLLGLRRARAPASYSSSAARPHMCSSSFHLRLGSTSGSFHLRLVLPPAPFHLRLVPPQEAVV